jgi:hypothetical protein
MIQLSYEPAFDPAHAMFRALRLGEGVLKPGDRVAKDLFRILDFYLLFPDRLKNARLRREHQRIKGIAERQQWRAPYGPRPDDQVLLRRMEPFVDVAVDHLAERGFLDSSALEDGWISGTAKELPAAIAERIATLNDADSELLAALRVLASEYPLEGADGLKDRTGLLEHRYDAA